MATVRASDRLAFNLIDVCGVRCGSRVEDWSFPAEEPHDGSFRIEHVEWDDFRDEAVKRWSWNCHSAGDVDGKI
jgi:hypothetical protein